MNTISQKPFLKHALVCIIAGVIGAIVTLRIGRKFLPWLPFSIQIVLACLYLAGTIIYLFWWKRKAVAKQINSETTQALWESIICYFISLDMVMFGVSKIFHLQFRTPLGVLDLPFSNISDGQLMWAFFGRSYPFIVLIACLQIAAGLLILFKHTRLFGIVFLLPILFNIFFIDVFYSVGLLVTVYALLLILACTYLLLLNYDKLVKAFFTVQQHELSAKSSRINAMVKSTVVLIPVLLIVINRVPLVFPEYTGKYLVQSVEIDSVKQAPVTCKDSVLTKVFIDGEDDDFVLEYNDYTRRLIGNYKYNNRNGQLTAVWRYPANQHDTLFAHLLPKKVPGVKLLIGRMGNQRFKITMIKAVPVK